MQITREMVRTEQIDLQEGVICLLAEDSSGDIVPTGRYMRWLAGQILDQPVRPKGEFKPSILKK